MVMKPKKLLLLREKLAEESIGGYQIQIQAMFYAIKDPLEGSHDTFINISKSLESHRINASRVLFHNPKIGMTIQTDLGDADLLSVMNEENKKSLIQQSLELLCKFQSIDIPNFV